MYDGRSTAASRTALSRRHAHRYVGDRYCCMEAGPVDLPPVLLLKGIGANSLHWRYQLASLPDRLRLIAWNAPGRLILPWTTSRGFMGNDPPWRIERRGGVFRIERRSSEFLAQWISRVAIFPCEGARDPLSEAALTEAFAKGSWEDVTGLCRNDDVPQERCWLRAPGWCLTR